MLCCENNDLTALPALPATLTFLSCRNNRLMDLPPLPTSLQCLMCDGNYFPNRIEGEPVLVFETRIRVWNQEQSRQRIQARMRLFKEELMMNRWHPARMDTYLEAGVDVDEL